MRSPLRDFVRGAVARAGACFARSGAAICGGLTLVALVGVAPTAWSQSRTTRPPHVLYGAASAAAPVPFLRRFRPEVQGTTLGALVVARAQERCVSEPRAVAAATVGLLGAVDVALGSVQAAAQASAGGYAPLDPPFRSRQGALAWPVSRNRLRAPFGDRARPELNLVDRHTGLSFQVVSGLPVYAAADGVVVYSASLVGLGTVLIVEHGDLYHTVYAGLSEALVAPGEPVTGGAEVGLAGAGVGRWTDEVYFEIRDRGLPVDPAPWLRR